MKINWGLKLAIVYLSFMAGILTLVFKAKGQKVDLVTQDYYKQELAFSQKLEATRNATGLPTPVVIEYLEGQVNVSFPAECLQSNMTGQITLYCPSDASRDRSVVIGPNQDGLQSIMVNDLPNGLYLAKVDWKMNDLQYYTEKAIDIQ